MKSYKKPEAEYISFLTEVITVGGEIGDMSSPFNSIEDEEFYE